MWSRRGLDRRRGRARDRDGGRRRARAQDFDRESPAAAFRCELEGQPAGSPSGSSGTGVDIPCGERCVVELPAGTVPLIATRPDGRRSAQYAASSRAAARHGDAAQPRRRARSGSCSCRSASPASARRREGRAGSGGGWSLGFARRWRVAPATAQATSRRRCCFPAAPSWRSAAAACIGVDGRDPSGRRTRTPASTCTACAASPPQPPTRVCVCCPCAGPRWSGLALSGGF